jgi:hypothetical protein
MGHVARQRALELGRYVNVIDHEFVWQAVTDPYAALFGYRRPRDLIGRPAWSASTKVNGERDQAARELHTTGMLSGVSTVVTRDGDRFAFSYRTIALNGGELYVTVGEPCTGRSNVNENGLKWINSPANTGKPVFDSLPGPAYRRDVLMAGDTTGIQWDQLAGRLIEARYHRRLTRKQLSQRAGQNREHTLRRYELGNVKELHEDVVFAFADALGCNPLWLMYGRGDPGYHDDWE